jgi:methionyl-tRNA synthetase
MSSYYITTPIYYVNDVPHIGHAYTTILSDILARFMRLDGRDVFFLTGTDEHGQKVEKSAIAKNMTPQEFTDKMSEPFRNLCMITNTSNDDFIRTTEERHKKGAEAFWHKLMSNGHIYKGKYSGWYSVRDEAFYSEDEISENKTAPTGAPVEWMEEESYFFNLSKWQDKLLEFYDNNPEFIRPLSRRNEVISFVKAGLQDLSISRTSMKWGIPVPNDEKHVMYVWLDALTNYITALGYPSLDNKYWPADIHMVGKDILRFHAIYWPAFLMAADIAPPKTVFAHGWWTNEGQKISKSLGNVIDPIKLIEQYGLDYFRYYISREVIIGNDGNFSHETFVNRINSELSNKIGNLCQRTIAFINKNLDSKVPEISDKNNLCINSDLLQLSYSSLINMRSFMEKQEINHCLDLIIKIADEANIFIDREAPWALKKTDLNRMNEVLFILIETIRCLGIYLLPFIPDSANRILNTLKINDKERNFSYISHNFSKTPQDLLDVATPIFQRIENK